MVYKKPKPEITKENFKEFLGEASSRLSEEDRKKVANFLKEEKKKTKFWRILKKRPGRQDVLLEKRKEARQEPLDMNKGGIVKRFKGGLMVKPKAAKRGY